MAKSLEGNFIETSGRSFHLLKSGKSGPRCFTELYLGQFCFTVRYHIILQSQIFD